MNFSIAVISKNRSHTKAFKRVMLDLQPLIDALENIEMKCPIGDSVLVMASDDELKMDLFLILRLIVKKVPFATPDHEQYDNIFQTMASKFIVP